MWFFLIFLIIQLIGYPLLGIRLIRSLLKKNKSLFKKSAIRLIILMIFSGLVFEKLPGSNLFYWPFEAVDSKFYTKSLTNKSFILKKPIYEFDSERAFNGDGRSFAIYPLTENIAQYFINPDSMFFKNYPKKDIRNGWEIKKWTRTPIRAEDLDAFHFASYTENQSEYNLEELLNENENYYAIKYYKHSFSDGEERILNVDFYVICPKRRILITINAVSYTHLTLPTICSV